MLLTFAFGLIHGLGFASVLRDIGIGGREVAWPCPCSRSILASRPGRSSSPPWRCPSSGICGSSITSCTGRCPRVRCSWLSRVVSGSCNGFGPHRNPLVRPDRHSRMHRCTSSTGCLRSPALFIGRWMIRTVTAWTTDPTTTTRAFSGSGLCVATGAEWRTTHFSSTRHRPPPLFEMPGEEVNHSRLSRDSRSLSASGSCSMAARAASGDDFVHESTDSWSR